MDIFGFCFAPPGELPVCCRMILPARRRFTELRGRVRENESRNARQRATRRRWSAEALVYCMPKVRFLQRMEFVAAIALISRHTTYTASVQSLDVVGSEQSVCRTTGPYRAYPAARPDPEKQVHVHTLSGVTMQTEHFECGVQCSRAYPHPARATMPPE
ncbi:hypothetical protein GQ53DRAFT_169754 [Thozetella sp. PMI_491]|nr:hypothetical protein GQ53DRAFT_169754 [Thozetella sp. PMI_491]